MYEKDNRVQLSFEDFYMPFGGHLRGDNRWVKAAEETDWAFIEDTYAPLLSASGMGARALSARLIVGSLMIKARMNFTDEETVRSISENPYMQFFLGYDGYSPVPPFDASMLTRARKRLPADVLNSISKRLINGGIKKT